MTGVVRIVTNILQNFWPTETALSCRRLAGSISNEGLQFYETKSTLPCRGKSHIQTKFDNNVIGVKLCTITYPVPKNNISFILRIIIIIIIIIVIIIIITMITIIVTKINFPYISLS
jgi:hypothetical protein